MSAGTSAFHDPRTDVLAAPWTGVDLGGTFGSPDTRDALDALTEHVDRTLRGAGLRADFVVAHVLPPEAGALLPRAGISVHLLGDDAVEGRSGQLADLLGGTVAPRLAQVSTARLSGTCLVFPGQAELRGVMPAWRVRATVIDSVLVGTTEVGDGELVELCGRLLPVFDGGRMVLRVVRTQGGRLMPFEPPAMIRHRRARF